MAAVYFTKYADADRLTADWNVYVSSSNTLVKFSRIHYITPQKSVNVVMFIIVGQSREDMQTHLTLEHGFWKALSDILLFNYA